MSKKVILPVINDLAIDQRMHKISLTLHENGYDVLLVGTKRQKTVPLQPREYKTDRFSLYFSNGKFFYLEFNIKLFFYLLFKKVDIITSNDLDTLLPCYLNSKLKGAELIYDSHEYFTEQPELDQRPATKKMWLKLEQFLFPKLNKITTVNQSLADIYSKLYKKDIKIVRNVPFRTKSVPIVKKENIVLYQGNINKSRGIETMLQALQQLENIMFWCVGPGDLLNEMQALAKELKVEHKVKFFGRIPFQNLREITLQAKIGISIEQPIGLNSTLCLPNKLLDYIQCRVPVIVSDLPELRNVVEKYQIGIILKEHSAQKLADAINDLIYNEDKLQQYIKNSEKAAEELCWEKEKEVLLELYQS
jgi:glycosyltransferase involved in cell wall biosynthesis